MHYFLKGKCFVHYLRGKYKILSLYWCDKVPSVEIRKHSKSTTIETVFFNRQLHYVGNVIHIPEKRTLLMCFLRWNEIRGKCCRWAVQPIQGPNQGSPVLVVIWKEDSVCEILTLEDKFWKFYYNIGHLLTILRS